MMQRNLLFTVLSIPIDIVMWLGAFIAAYLLRAHYDTLPVTYVWPFRDYIMFILAIAPLVFFTLVIEGLYNHRYPKKGLAQFSSIFVAATVSVMFVVLWVFFSRSFFFSRLLIVYAWILSIIFLLIGRWLIALVQVTLNRLKIGLRKVAIIAPPELAQEISTQIRQNPKFGFEVVATGTQDNLPAILKKRRINDLLVADRKLTQNQLVTLTEMARDGKATLHITPSALQLGTSRFALCTIAGMPAIEILETSLEGIASIFKRLFDIAGAIIFITLFSWLYLIVALVVKLTSPGPVLYKDRRVGSSGEFNLYKFRTFKKEYCTGSDYGGKEAEEFEDRLISEKNTRVGPIPKIKEDPRVTSVGKFLRRTSLDELPQFFNVIIGNMSIVGPRPHRPKEVAHYKPRHRKLFLIKPGVTGMAQVSGRSDLDFEDEADLDIYYIEKWSIWLDIQIIWQTLFVVIKSRGAY